MKMLCLKVLPYDRRRKKCYYEASALLIANGFAVKSNDGVRQSLGKEFVPT